MGKHPIFILSSSIYFFFFSSLGWRAREGYGDVEGERPLGQFQPKTLLVVSIVAMLYRHYS